MNIVHVKYKKPSKLVWLGVVICGTVVPYFALVFFRFGLHHLGYDISSVNWLDFWWK
ncbi:MAG TPA: hypothetical protein VMR73_01040 [Candidatus Paceibacterota bacterium]|nr:hypothetical protein [Candidatus Paceibacterota bacterium]